MNTKQQEDNAYVYPAHHTEGLMKYDPAISQNQYKKE